MSSTTSEKQRVRSLAIGAAVVAVLGGAYFSGILKFNKSGEVQVVEAAPTKPKAKSAKPAGTAAGQPTAAAPNAPFDPSKPTYLLPVPAAEIAATAPTNPATESSATGAAPSTVPAVAGTPDAASSAATHPTAEAPTTGPAVTVAGDAPAPLAATAPSAVAAPATGADLIAPSTTPVVAVAPMTSPAVASTPAAPAAPVSNGSVNPKMAAMLAAMRASGQLPATPSTAPTAVAAAPQPTSSRDSGGRERTSGRERESSRTRERSSDRSQERDRSRDDRSVAGAGRPATNPTAVAMPYYRPPPTPTMDPQYASLLRGSMFAKTPYDSYVDGVDANGNPLPPRNNTDRGGPTPPPGPGPSAESNLALRGVVIEENTKYAFIEDMTTHTLSRLQVGEKVAQGTVAEVTWDDIVYDGHGKKTRVAIGSNLDGVAAPLDPGYAGTSTTTSSSSPSAYSGGPPSFGGPGGGSSNGFGSPGGDPRPTGALSAVEEAMRRRRQQQGGGRGG